MRHPRGWHPWRAHLPTSIPPSKREETEPDERVVDEIYRHELLRRLPRVESSVVITVTHEPWRKTLKKTPLKLVAPATEKRTVTPRRSAAGAPGAAVCAAEPRGVAGLLGLRNRYRSTSAGVAIDMT